MIFLFCLNTLGNENKTKMCSALNLMVARYLTVFIVNKSSKLTEKTRTITNKSDMIRWKVKLTKEFNSWSSARTSDSWSQQQHCMYEHCTLSLFMYPPLCVLRNSLRLDNFQDKCTSTPSLWPRRNSPNRFIPFSYSFFFYQFVVSYCFIVCLHLFSYGIGSSTRYHSVSLLFSSFFYLLSNWQAYC